MDLTYFETLVEILKYSNWGYWNFVFWKNHIFENICSTWEVNCSWSFHNLKIAKGRLYFLRNCKIIDLEDNNLCVSFIHLYTSTNYKDKEIKPHCETNPQLLNLQIKIQFCYVYDHTPTFPTNGALHCTFGIVGKLF